MREKSSVLVVDDDPEMQLALNTSLARAGYEVQVAGDGTAALELLSAQSVDVIVSDQRMPGMSGQELLKAVQDEGYKIPFIMITAHGTIDQAVSAMQLGAADFITKPFSAEDLQRIIERVLNPEARAFRDQSKRSGSAAQSRSIISNDPFMIRVLEVAEAVAKSDATVLIQGESGTGKELIARLIHGSSVRAKQPFVAVNCAALPEQLLESELFGHEKGAFTGAQNRKPGKFELAHGGTILLDEISEMDICLQAKLLRVLQEREIDRVGGRETISIDVRVLATTNKNLEEAVRSGSFRADLFYRLNVIPLTLPPLRQRMGDVKLLIEYFMRKYLGDAVPALTSDVLEALMQYPWPGNIRELQNAVERAAILSAGKTPQKGHFLLNQSIEIERSSISAIGAGAESCATSLWAGDVASSSDTGESGAGLRIRSGTTVQEMEKNLILETLKATQNNRTHAAKLLGISIRTLRNKLHEYGFARQAEGME